MNARDTLKINEKGHLEIGGADCCALAERFGTPLYLYDEKYIRRMMQVYRDVLRREYGENGTNSESGNHSQENQQENHTEPPIAIPIPEGVEIPEELLQHDHDHETEPTEEVHDHDHEHVAVDTEQAGVSLLALLLAVALIAGAVVLITVLLKRKKRK